MPQQDVSLTPYDVTLNKAGDTFDLELFATGFRHVTGSKPFYVYSRLGGAGESYNDSQPPSRPSTGELLLSTRKLLQFDFYFVSH